MGKTGEEGETDDVEDERNDDDESNSASDSSELATRMPPEPKGSPMAAALNPSASSVVVMVHLLCPDMELSIADNPRWHINCMNLLQNSVHTFERILNATRSRLGPPSASIAPLVLNTSSMQQSPLSPSQISSRMYFATEHSVTRA